ncbi:LLM class flavin-dependent oxidoreductase [Haematomicrobium sanguinis]|uniref:LLM class flavin-dependent oxidoreductase n=1 Tax=Haematomicrobium sanguinis TaxID=479106 RepID=UPI00047AE2C1|nr:LLM class flavin-dependent oxidoreductase [Haematomicrobium sanguinis]
MELGVYSFGNTPINEDGTWGSTAQAQRNLVEAIELADKVGLDFFGIGEHHTEEMPASAAATVLAAASRTTKNITLGSSVTVISTDDPVRVYQQFATLDALSDGRAEIVAGRGSSIESFPLFGYDLQDYDQLFAEKLDLLLKINDTPNPVSWEGTVRPALEEQVIVPRPDSGKLPIWIGTGGNPYSTLRAAQLKHPIFYAIIGGNPARFGELAKLYRQAAEASGATPEDMRIGISNPGFVWDEGDEARDLWWPTWQTTMGLLGQRRGFPPPSRANYDYDTSDEGALFVGSPEEVADRIVALHKVMGQEKHILQMDFTGLTQEQFLHSIELMGTKVKPLVEEKLAKESK